MTDFIKEANEWLKQAMPPEPWVGRSMPFKMLMEIKRLRGTLDQIREVVRIDPNIIYVNAQTQYHRVLDIRAILKDEEKAND